MTMHHRPYLSYLVRLWGEISQGQVVWRAAVESVQSGEQRQFATVESLFAWIDVDRQAEEQMKAVVMGATIQAGKVDELLILWRTSVAPALLTLSDLSHVSLLVDWMNHRLLIIALYTALHAPSGTGTGSQWPPIFTPLTAFLQTTSLHCEVYDLVDAQDLAARL